MATSYAAELVTGKTGEAHVSSNDVRDYNRATISYDPVRLDNINGVAGCAITIAGQSITIGTGGILWNGMHIRNRNAIELTNEASWSIFWVYLEYTKDASTQIEGVTWKISNTEGVSAHTFTDATNSARLNVAKVESGTIKYQINRLNENAKIDQKIEKLKSIVTLWSGTCAVGGNLSLSESFKNFERILILADRNKAMADLYVYNDSSSNGSLFFWTGTRDISLLGGGKWDNDPAMFNLLAEVRFIVSSNTAITFERANFRYIDQGVATTTTGTINIKAIYGVGRIAG